MGFGERSMLGELRRYPPDALFSAISVEGILSHSHISISEFITNFANTYKVK